MNNNKAGLWLRALAQPTTYLGVAMLAFIFAGAELSADTVARGRGGRGQAQRRERRAHCSPQSISRLLTNADNTLLLLRKFYESHPDETGFIQWPTRIELQEGPRRSSIRWLDPTASSRRIELRSVRASVSTFRTWSISRRRPRRPRTGCSSASRSDPAPPGKWGIVLTRRLTAPDGSFAGIITSVVRPVAAAKTVSESRNLARTAASRLMDFDGVIYSRTVARCRHRQVSSDRGFPHAGVLKQVAHVAARASIGTSPVRWTA